MKLWVVLGVALMLAVLPMSAQDEAEPVEGCEAAALADTLAELVEAVREAEDVAGALREVASAAGVAAAACDGLAFDSEKDGMMPVIGPVTIPEGIYRVTLTTEGYYILGLDVLEGECGQGERFRSSLFLISRGDATDGAQVVLNSTGCETLLSISNVTDPWVLDFEKLR